MLSLANNLLLAVGADQLMPIIMIVLLIAVFYFMYRSQKKQEREQDSMRNSLEVGDEITTIGGIVGEIVSIREETITIETGKDRTKIKFLRYNNDIRTVMLAEFVVQKCNNRAVFCNL